MKVRNKKTKVIGESSTFNTYGIGEIIVAFEDGEYDSCYGKDFDVFINNEWVDLSEAFKQRLVITDNYQIRFFEPQTEEDKVRGFTL